MLTLVFCNAVFCIPVNYFSQYITHIAALVTLCAGINHLSILIGGCWLQRTWNVCMVDIVRWFRWARKTWYMCVCVWQCWFCCCNLLGLSTICTHMSDACRRHLPNLKKIYSISSSILFCSRHSIKSVCCWQASKKYKSLRVAYNVRLSCIEHK